MAGKDGNSQEDYGSILTHPNLPQLQEGKVDPGDLIHAVLADKSALEMRKSVIKADTQQEQISKADQAPSTQAGAIKARQKLDPEVTIIEPNPPKKPRWDVSQPNTSSSVDPSC